MLVKFPVQRGWHLLPSTWDPAWASGNSQQPTLKLANIVWVKTHTHTSSIKNPHNPDVVTNWKKYCSDLTPSKAWAAKKWKAVKCGAELKGVSTGSLPRPPSLPLSLSSCSTGSRGLCLSGVPGVSLKKQIHPEPVLWTAQIYLVNFCFLKNMLEGYLRNDFDSSVKAKNLSKWKSLWNPLWFMEY